MNAENTQRDSLRFRLLTRLVIAAGTLKQSKQDWLLKREMIHGSDKKSVLFLYPVVMITYDQSYYPRFDCLLKDMNGRTIEFLPEYN